MAYIQGRDRAQITLFPETIDDYIGPDNIVRVIDAFVRSLDLEKLGFQRATPGDIGRPSYDPRDMLALYIYGYLVGRVRSSRRLEMDAGRNLELMWLLRKLQPDYKTISDFRKDNVKALKEVFKAFTLMCKEWNLLGQQVVAVDGSKFRANNSKRNNFNEKKLNRHLKYIDEKIESYLNELDKNDREEAGVRTPSVEEINKRIEELKNRKTQYQEMQALMEETGVKEISTTDPDARQMAVNNKGLDICYNVQTAVDDKHKLVVHCEATNNPADQQQLSTICKKSKEILDADDLKALADKGYYSTGELKECKANGIETYVPKPDSKPGNIPDPRFSKDHFLYNKDEDFYTCPAGQTLFPGRLREEHGTKYRDYKNNRACQKCESKEHCTKSAKGRSISRNLDQELIDEVDLRTRENKDLYKQRQMIVEHPFGTVKRVWGYDCFLTKGLESVQAETSLAFLAYNLRRVINILGVDEIMSKLVPTY